MLRHLVLLLANQMEANDPVEILQILAGTVVVYSLIGDSSTLPVVVTHPQIIIGEPPSSMPLTQVVDENYPGQRLSPMTQLPPQLGGKGLLGEGGPFLLQRGEERRR
jgi:hypothetical protein